MPNLFNKAPIVGAFYDKFSEDQSNGGEVYEQLPSPQFDFLKEKMRKLKKDIEQYKTLTNKPKKLNNLDSKYVPVFAKAQKILEESTDPKQFSMNVRTKLNYLHYRLNEGDQDSSKFTEWYISDLYNQCKELRFEMTKEYAFMKKMMHEEIELKTTMLNYQDEIIHNLSEWIEFIDDKVDESTKIVKSLDADVSTENRFVSMKYDSIQKKDVLKENLIFVSWILLFIFFIFMVILYYKQLFQLFGFTHFTKNSDVI